MRALAVLTGVRTWQYWWDGNLKRWTTLHHLLALIFKHVAQVSTNTGVHHNDHFSSEVITITSSQKHSKSSHTWCWSKGLAGGCFWSCEGYWELWRIRASRNPNRQSWAPGCTEEQLLLDVTARRMQMKLSCASVMVGGIHLEGTKAITKMTVCVFPSSGGQQEEPLAGANNAVCTTQIDWLRRGRSRRTGTGAAYSLMISLITWGRHRLLSHTLPFDKDSLHNENPVPSPSLAA